MELGLIFPAHISLCILLSDALIPITHNNKGCRLLRMCAVCPPQVHIQCSVYSHNPGVKQIQRLPGSGLPDTARSRAGSERSHLLAAGKEEQP